MSATSPLSKPRTTTETAGKSGIRRRTVAHQHYKVTKIKGKEHTSTGIDHLTPAQRVEEIARMIGGMEITAATRALAQEMLG